VDSQPFLCTPIDKVVSKAEIQHSNHMQIFGLENIPIFDGSVNNFATVNCRLCFNMSFELFAQANKILKPQMSESLNYPHYQE